MDTFHVFMDGWKKKKKKRKEKKEKEKYAGSRPIISYSIQNNHYRSFP